MKTFTKSSLQWTSKSLPTLTSSLLRTLCCRWCLRCISSAYTSSSLLPTLRHRCFLRYVTAASYATSPPLPTLRHRCFLRYVISAYATSPLISTLHLFCVRCRSCFNATSSLLRTLHRLYCLRYVAAASYALRRLFCLRYVATAASDPSPLPFARSYLGSVRLLY